MHFVLKTIDACLSVMDTDIKYRDMIMMGA